jgi:multimeric flavodoxin WrbA
MKVLTIVGSHRKNGNTANIVNMLNAELSSQANNNEIIMDTVYLAHRNIQMCRGCRVCFDQGEQFCPLNDDLLHIKEKIDGSDLLILASPVYVEDVTGIMKNWIDRMAFVCHRPEYFSKAAYVLSTSGIGSTNHTLITMNKALRTWGFSVIGQITFITDALMEQEELNKRYKAKISKISNKMIKSYQSSSSLKPSFLALMIFAIQQLYYKKDDNRNTLDYKYWVSRGWLDNDCIYYSKIKAVKLKVLSARIIGRFLAKVVLK